jgi:hypothetical protein
VDKGDRAEENSQERPWERAAHGTLGDGWLSHEGCLREEFSEEGGRGAREFSLEYCVGPLRVNPHDAAPP